MDTWTMKVLGPSDLTEIANELRKRKTRGKIEEEEKSAIAKEKLVSGKIREIFDGLYCATF